MMIDLINNNRESLIFRRRIRKLEKEQKQHQRRILKLENSVDKLNSRLDRLMKVVFVYIKNRVDSETAILMQEAWESDNADERNERRRNKYKN